MWYVCTKVDERPILVPMGEQIPEGYIAEVSTCNPDYLQQQFPTVVTASDFRDRFTSAELINILAAAYGGDTTAQLLLLKIQTNSTGVDLRIDETIQGVQYLVSIGAISSDRATAILT